MGNVRYSFRGARVGILGCPAPDEKILARQLARLGVQAIPLNALGPEHLCAETRLDALFLDDDADLSSDILPLDAGGALAIIALVGSEAPSHLEKLLKRDISAHLMKPVRQVGVLTAMQIARHNFQGRREFAARIERLEERLEGRRFVVSAQLSLMSEHGISESDAFARLRGAAMRRRMTIEAVSVELLAGSRGGN
ncbi:MAG: ANTAR domain-containing protein [Paracoccaceae bacterium]